MQNKTDLNQLKKKVGIIPFSDAGLRQGANVCCFHDDHKPSLSVLPDREGHGFYFKCQACGAGGDVIAFVALKQNITNSAAIKLLAAKYQPEAVATSQNVPPSGPGMTLVEYSTAKHIVPMQFLVDWFGVHDGRHPYYSKLKCAVAFPYWNERGEQVTTQWRWGMGSKDRKFESGKPTYLYGGRFLQHLEQMAEAGNAHDTIYICEGESNTHTLSINGFAAVGLPGVGNWRREWAKLKCFQQAKWIYFLLDMKEGKPEDAAVVGARKVAESFEPGKVLAIKLPTKDVSALWLYHMAPDDHPANSIGFARGQQGFCDDFKQAFMRAKPIIPETEQEEGLPDDLGSEVLDACPILKEFVDLTLPQVETDINNLICDFLACAGTAIGLKAYACVNDDKHPAATYHLLIGETGLGKGTSFNCTAAMFKLAVDDWNKRIRHSARSQQSLYRMLKEASESEITITDKEDNKSSEPNPNYTEGSLLIRFSEVSSLFKGMRAEWSTMSGALRETFDGKVVSNELSQKESSVTVDKPYTLAIIGDISPWELSETIEGVDFANGVANRFIWCRARKTKTITRAGRLPDYSDLAARLRRVIPSNAVGQIEFSDGGGKAWDAWVYSLPLEDGGRLGSACARTRANALRIAVQFAVLDESRLVIPGLPISIEARHVHGAAAIMRRHRNTVQQFLERPAAVPDTLPETVKSKLWSQVEKVRDAMRDGCITGNQLCKLFSHETADGRRVIAEAAGLQYHEEVDEKGVKVTTWR